MKFNNKIIFAILACIIACSLASKSSRNQGREIIEKCKALCGITEKAHIYRQIVAEKSKIICKCQGILFSNYFAWDEGWESTKVFKKFDPSSEVKDIDGLLKKNYQEVPITKRRRY